MFPNVLSAERISGNTWIYPDEAATHAMDALRYALAGEHAVWKDKHKYLKLVDTVTFRRPHEKANFSDIDRKCNLIAAAANDACISKRG